MANWYVCKECGIQFQREAKKGPAPIYCSSPCRRAEYERKKKTEKREAREKRLANIPTPQCRVCGVEIGGRKKYQQYCSSKCANSVRRKYYICTGCGKEYTTALDHNANHRRFCSKDCFFAFFTARKERRRLEPKPVRSFKCNYCGELFAQQTTERYCSDECRRRYGNRQSNRYDPTKRNYQCKECGKAFFAEYGTKRRTFCSDECLYKYNRRIGKSVRRARKHAVAYETVDPIKVFERDKWRCHICNTKTPRSLRGTFNNRAPGLDHIIPLAQNGPHTYTNTACACRKCNLEKGAEWTGQLRLIG